MFTSVDPVISPLTDSGPLIVAARPTILPATWPVTLPIKLPVTPPSTAPLKVVAVTTPETFTLVDSTWVIVDTPLTILPSKSPSKPPCAVTIPATSILSAVQKPNVLIPEVT